MYSREKRIEKFKTDFSTQRKEEGNKVRKGERKKKKIKKRDRNKETKSTKNEKQRNKERNQSVKAVQIIGDKLEFFTLKSTCKKLTKIIMNKRQY